MFKDILKYAAYTEADQSAIYLHYQDKMTLEQFQQIVSADPTSKTLDDGFVKYVGNYSKWLLNLFIKKQLKIEDLYKATEYLTVFDKRKAKLPTEYKDINRYKDLPFLYSILTQYNLFEIKTQREKKQNIHKGANDIKEIYEDSTWRIITPLNEEASCFWGSGTQWCTAARGENNLFNEYNEHGPLYIVINKNTNQRGMYQLHFESNQFMDAEDKPILIWNWINTMPKVTLFLINEIIIPKVKEKINNEGDSQYLKIKFTGSKENPIIEIKTTIEELLESLVNTRMIPMNTMQVLFNMTHFGLPGNTNPEAFKRFIDDENEALLKKISKDKQNSSIQIAYQKVYQKLYIEDYYKQLNYFLDHLGFKDADASDLKNKINITIPLKANSTAFPFFETLLKMIDDSFAVNSLEFLTADLGTNDYMTGRSDGFEFDEPVIYIDDIDEDIFNQELNKLLVKK